MAKTQYAYKAVTLTKKPGVFRSLYEVYPMEYRIGKKTVAKAGGLICYATDSRYFSEVGQLGRVLLKVEVSKPVELPKAGRLDHQTKVTLKALRDFWENGTGAIHWGSWNEGTVAFKEVTPLYLVDKNTKRRITDAKKKTTRA